MTNLYTQSYAICPWCEQKSGQQVDHLFSGRSNSAGPWSCNACGRWFSVKVSADNEVALAKSKEPALGRWLVLLKLETKEKPVYFVADAYGHAGADPEKVNSNHRYFYEEHACPTNWLCDVLMVAQDGGPDPHGIWDHVRTVEVARDFDTNSDAAIMTLFAELQ